MTPDKRLAEVRRLYHQMHQDDSPPQTTRERQDAVVLARIRQMGLNLLMQGVTPRILELALFYQWVRVSALLQGLSEAQCDAWTADMGALMTPVVGLLKALEPTLPDTGPTPTMHTLSTHVQQLKNLVQTLEARPVAQADLLRHTDLTNRTAFGVVGGLLDAQIHPGLITTVLLYYWLRMSTINANVPEVFFQKLERHWERVIPQVEAWVAARAKQGRR
ncbi:MAG: hypothetical protein AB7N91_14595 [Candidatus Tectimicrobiota bacterium]